MVSGEASHLLHGTIDVLELSVKSWGGHGRVSFIFNFEHSTILLLSGIRQGIVVISTLI